MRVFKTRAFQGWAKDEALDDTALLTVVDEMERGLIDASLGGHVYKKRVATPGRGKRGGLRILIVYKQADRAFIVYGFSKNELANIGSQELKALKALAKELLSYTTAGLEKAVNANELFEVVAK